MSDISASFETALLQCPPLRDAVYRNQTPSRGLRHAVSFGCLPFSTFAAVGPWLPPWDVVPPAEACAKVEALHINARHGSYDKSVASVEKVAEIICRAVTAAAPGSPAPFSKVKSFDVSFTSVNDYRADVAEYDHAVHRITRSLPALQHLHLGRPFNLNGLRPADAFWMSSMKHAVELLGAEPGEPLLGDEAIAAFHRLPKLTSIDLSNSDFNMKDAFFTSLLLCRGTVKRVSWKLERAIPCLLCPDGNPSFINDRHVRLESEAPTSTTPASILVDAGGQIPATVVPRVPVHWTLEAFSMHNAGATLPMTDLQLLVLMCPRLKQISIASCQVWWVDEGLLKGWSFRRVLLDADAARPVIVDDELLGRSAYFSIAPGEAEVMARTHLFVQELLAAYEEDPTLHQRHAEALDRITTDRTYPAALLWALGRGREHTTLTTLRLWETLSDEAAEEVAAVVALATRLRRKNHRSRKE